MKKAWKHTVKTSSKKNRNPYTRKHSVKQPQTYQGNKHPALEN